ncbi:DUF6221 family protein [Nocardia wallacei]|uniref:DUF6221 family protein n=1 Tax=Nocardia wallacei TaxID=480035 RepID=UPI00245855A8|nr:DUF6221 family protein [Nocardia wallacei]
MTDLAIEDFIRARIDESEATALAARGAPDTRWVVDGGEVWAVCGDMTTNRCDQHELGRPNMCDDIPVGGDPDFDPGGHKAAHIAANDPAHVLRLVALLRWMLKSHEASADWRPTDYRAGYGSALDDALRYVAALWEDHPGYKTAWRP